MMLNILKSKIHSATVSTTNVDYVGSITIDKRLAKAAGLVEYEKVLVSNMTNGSRFETYVILGQEEGVVEVNGAAALITNPRDRIIVMGFALMDDADAEGFKPNVVAVDERNKIVG